MTFIFKKDRNETCAEALRRWFQEFEILKAHLEASDSPEMFKTVIKKIMEHNQAFGEIRGRLLIAKALWESGHPYTFITQMTGITETDLVNLTKTYEAGYFSEPTLH